MSRLPLFHLILNLLICLVMGGLAGCGGTDSSGGQAPVASVVPDTLTEYDGDGNISSQTTFHYPDPMTIRAEIRTAGEDGLWQTGDDTAGLHMACHYAPNEAGLPQTPVRGMEMMHPRCPERQGLILVRQDLCKRSDLCTPELTGFRLRFRRNSQPRLVTGSQTFAEYSDGTTLPNEFPNAFGTQTTTWYLDNGGRPTRFTRDRASTWDDFLIDSCTIDSVSLAICRAMRSEVRYTYDGDHLNMERDVYSALTHAYTERWRYENQMDQNLFWKSEGGSFPPADPSQELFRWQYREDGQLTRKESIASGPDEIWFTDDDVVEVTAHYQYRNDGLIQDIDISGSRSLDFEYRDDDKRERVLNHYFGGAQVENWTEQHYHYDQGRLTRIVERFSETGDQPGAYTMSREISFRPLAHELRVPPSRSIFNPDRITTIQELRGHYYPGQ